MTHQNPDTFFFNRCFVICGLTNSDQCGNTVLFELLEGTIIVYIKKKDSGELVVPLETHISIILSQFLFISENIFSKTMIYRMKNYLNLLFTCTKLMTLMYLRINFRTSAQGYSVDGNL